MTKISTCIRLTTEMIEKTEEIIAISKSKNPISPTKTQVMRAAMNYGLDYLRNQMEIVE